MSINPGGGEFDLAAPRPEFANCFRTTNWTARNFIRAQTLLQEEPFTPEAASTMVEFACAENSKLYPVLREVFLGNLNGKTEEQVRQELEDAAQMGGTIEVSILYRAVKERFPDLPIGEIELAGLLKTAYLSEAEALSKPTEPIDDERLSKSEREALDEELSEMDRETQFELRTCAQILEAAESALKAQSNPK